MTTETPHEKSSGARTPVPPTEPPAPPEPASAERLPNRPRHGSGTVARLLAVAYAVIVTPIATGLLSYGGGSYRLFSSRAGYVEPQWESLVPQLVLGTGVGLLLLASVLCTGIASSAGLLAVGVMGLVSMALTVVPTLLVALYQSMSELIPSLVLDGLVHGIPVVLHPLMGGLGLALLIARRRPDPHLAASLVGLVLLPLGLLLATGLLLAGLGFGAAEFMMTFDTRISLAAVVLVLVGALLMWLSGTGSFLSPYALVLPSLILLGATYLVLPVAMRSTIVNLLWSGDAGRIAFTFLSVGGGIAAAVAMLVHVPVLAVVRARARRRIRTLADRDPASGSATAAPRP